MPSIIVHASRFSPTAFATSSVHHHWFLHLGVPHFPDDLPHSSSAIPRNASLYCLHSPSTVPFSASSSSYYLLTLSLHSTIISSFHHLLFVGPIVLISFHFFMRTSKTTGLAVWWHTLPPTLCSASPSWAHVAAPPVGRALSCAVRSCRWFCGSPSSGRTFPRPPTRSSSTSPPVLALPCSLFPIQIFLCFLRLLAQPHRCVHWNRPQRTASSDRRSYIHTTTF